VADFQGQVRMLKISILEDSRQYRLILEGKLIAPWTVELTTAWKAARADLKGRRLILDLRSLTGISPDGESVLLQLMNEDITFQCGVFMREVLKQLTRKRQRRSERAPNEENPDLEREG
jgi:hypothetical protein